MDLGPPDFRGVSEPIPPIGTAPDAPELAERARGSGSDTWRWTRPPNYADSCQTGFGPSLLPVAPGTCNHDGDMARTKTASSALNLSSEAERDAFATRRDVARVHHVAGDEESDLLVLWRGEIGAQCYPSRR